MYVEELKSLQGNTLCNYKVTHFVRIAQIFSKDARIMIYNVYYYMQ